MLSRSTWLHLRIPFSFFLAPVFLFAAATSPNLNPWRLIIVFTVLHVFLYPASNGYNSYFDKDEKSIGGLKNPPKVKRELYFTSLVFDAIAILLGLIINWELALLLLVYGLVSKAYSHPNVRLKKYPIISWLVAGSFQGAFTFIMAYIGLNNSGMGEFLNSAVIIPALLSSAILWGSYPMTQIYQHEEDAKRGDITLSYKLGINGTFIFTAITFAIAVGFFWWYFTSNYSILIAWIFLGCMVPVLTYFNYWFIKVLKDSSKADFSHTMKLNFISAFFLNFFFLYLLVIGN